MVQCLDHLFFAISGTHDVEMFKVDQIGSGKPIITKMSSLGRIIYHFSFTTFKNKKIFLTGGVVNDKIT